YGTKDAFNHGASEGFIELWSLPTETANAVRQGQRKGGKSTAKASAAVNVTKPGKAIKGLGGLKGIAGLKKAVKAKA
ncbi:MAG: hypothetical protein ABR586_10555, partial [Thermoplasmatota archaeon]